MKHWNAIQKHLSAIPLKSRKEVFKEFRIAHSNWRAPTLAVLERIVVRMERQVNVCLEQNLRKQALNRSVRHYKFFLSKHKTFKQLIRKNHERKNSMD